jgi:hypothetical protein
VDTSQTRRGRNKFQASFPAHFHPVHADGSVFFFSHVSKVWKVVVDFADTGILNRLVVGDETFYRSSIL